MVIFSVVLSKHQSQNPNHGGPMLEDQCMSQNHWIYHDLSELIAQVLAVKQIHKNKSSYLF